MAFIYTRAQLKERVNANIHGKIGMLIDDEETMNDAVREVLKLDLRSARRRALLSPNLFEGPFDYACPSDLMGYKVIDLPAQAVRDDGSFNLVPSEQFRVNPKRGEIAIDDFNNTRVLKVYSKTDSDQIVVSELDSLTSGGGTWGAFGDGESVAADSDDYVKGNGSVKYAISSAGGTTAGIVNSTLDSFDLTEYLNGTGALFVWKKISSTTNITNFILRIGTDSSNYYQKTVTAQHDGTAFINGWNLLRFDLTSLSETGSVTDTTTRYIALYMTKTAGKVSETGYKFDWITLMKGKFTYVQYYTKCGWTTSAGSYLENSTNDTDLLVADTDEYNLIIEKASELAADEVDEDDTAEKYRAKYTLSSKKYQLENPSEAKVMTSEYYTY